MGCPGNPAYFIKILPKIRIGVTSQNIGYSRSLSSVKVTQDLYLQVLANNLKCEATYGGPQLVLVPVLSSPDPHQDVSDTQSKGQKSGSSFIFSFKKSYHWKWIVQYRISVIGIRAGMNYYTVPDPYYNVKRNFNRCFLIIKKNFKGKSDANNFAGEISI